MDLHVLGQYLRHKLFRVLLTEFVILPQIFDLFQKLIGSLFSFSLMPAPVRNVGCSFLFWSSLVLAERSSFALWLWLLIFLDSLAVDFIVTCGTRDHWLLRSDSTAAVTQRNLRLQKTQLGLTSLPALLILQKRLERRR